ncbi:MAG TPA: M1 family aminopeptidase [Herpetosiphonaceae bacterium]|nr:M1 family aminopeptidase [Herpetosiphonaceae bacterium]
MEVQPLRYLASARRVVVLATMLVVAGCAGVETAAPAPTTTSSPPPSPVPATAVPQPTAMPAPTLVPTATPARPSATPAPQTTPGETSTPSPVLPAATASLPPAAAQSTAEQASGCDAAHVASVAESSDLYSGSAFAPDLNAFNRYRMDLALDPDQALLTGTQTLDFTNRTGAPLPDLVFHLYPNLPDFEGRLEITCAAVDGAAVRPLLEDDDWKLRLPLPVPLAPDASTQVTLRFTTTTPRGTGATAYGAFNLQEGIWTLASFYPTLAIRVGEAWDPARPSGWSDYVNSDMALYHARISMPAGYALLSSGVADTTCASGTCSVVAAAGPQRDFILAVSREWEQSRRVVGETTVVSSFPPQWRAAGERALDLAVDALARFNDRFGLYPYVELDILPVTAGNFAGVEYPGLIMINDSYYDENGDRTAVLLDVVVHEVAHMWWYNVVGNDVLREPWLDEGLTSYSAEYLYTEWSGQGAQPLTEARLAQLQQLGLDKTPIDLEVTEYADARSYVAVIYGRAPLFFDALRGELGDDAFFRLLREHYRRNAFGRATTEGFEKLAEEIAGRELDPFLSAWLADK